MAQRIKNRLSGVAVELTLALFVALVSMWATYALAAEPVVCSVSIGTGAATITSSPTSGTCTWASGSTVLMACDQLVYVNSTSPTKTGVPTTATSADQLLDFASNKDPYPIYLDAYDKHISMLAATTAGTCKFMTTKRRKPF